MRLAKRSGKEGMVAETTERDGESQQKAEPREDPQGKDEKGARPAGRGGGDDGDGGEEEACR